MNDDAPKDQEALTKAERINVQVSIAQTVLAVVGIFIGVVALYAALSEAEAVRKQLQASVWPYVQVTTENYGLVGEETFAVIVRNRGIGPAKIEHFSLSVDGEEKLNWPDVINEIADGERFGFSNYRVNGSVIAANEDLRAIFLEAKFSSSEMAIAFRDLMRGDRITWKVCYCSVFDACFRLDQSMSKPAEAERCEAPNLETTL